MDSKFKKEIAYATKRNVTRNCFFQVSDVVHVALVLKKIVLENDGNMHICSIVLIKILMLTIRKVLAIQSTCFLHI